MVDLVFHQHSVTQAMRSTLLGQQGFVLWYTGLSAAGKSSIANAVDLKLHQMRLAGYLLDGDNIRLGLNKDLGFSNKDRIENIRRIGEVANLFMDAGLIIQSAFISPFASDRELVRDLLPPGKFIEVFVDTPLAICEARDPKGMYKKARQGEIKHFTGIDSDYQKPKRPEIHLKAGELSIGDCANLVIKELDRLKLICLD